MPPSTPRRRITPEIPFPPSRKVEDLTLHEILALLRGPQHEDATEKQMGCQICVLDRGFVYVGEVTITGKDVEIRNAQNIRQWGTSRGLGELALNGPLVGTRLDPAGVVRCTLAAVMHFIETDGSKWPQQR